MPANMLAPAIPAVADDARPANSNANAKMVSAAGPIKGLNNSSACSNSVTAMPWLKNTAAASKIMAELIIQPMPIDNNVSTNSYRNWRCIISLSCRLN